MKDRGRREVVGALAAMLAFGLLSPAPVVAQVYPSKPIILVVPFPPGGTSDVNARLVAQELTEQFGQQVIVENRPGANGNIGSASVVRAPADGYTLLLSGVGSHAINAGLYATMPYDPVKDFSHITMFATGPNALVVHPDFPAKTFKEFVEIVKANPGKYNYASSGSGASGHLSMEMLKQRAGLEINHVPYKGGAPALTDVIGGQVPALFINQDAVLPHVKTGKLRILAVTSEQRNPLYPDTPTVAERAFRAFPRSHGLASPPLLARRSRSSIACGRADATGPGNDLFVVHGVAARTDDAKLCTEQAGIGDGVLREALEPRRPKQPVDLGVG